MMHCGLLGKTLAHSHSPALHRLLGGYEYTLFEKSPDEVEDFLKNGAWDGLNVTIPYKKIAYALCDELSPAAKATGNVNTLLRRQDGSIYGDNTDYFGFQYLLEKAHVDPRGKKALVLGSGGASGTVCAVLHDLGAEVTVVSRTPEKSANVLNNSEISFISYINIFQQKDAKIIVNTTPVGMYPHNGEAAVNLEEFPNLEFVADIIYNPARTALLLQAEKLGIPCAGGLSMLAAQAAVSSAIFLEEGEIDWVKIHRAEDMLRRQTQNIVLIGMPGCGKTTVGIALGKALRRPVWDCDEEIARKAGKTIEEIFARWGEERFRELETEVLADLGKRWGGIIATGGGCVTRAENRDLLRQNGRIIWLQRSGEKCAAAGRPLLQRFSWQELYRQRAALYEDFCDETVFNNAAPEDAVQKIREIIE